jgi:hypothetical protein
MKLRVLSGMLGCVFRLTRDRIMRKKLRELTMYIAQKGKADPAFGKTKLYKTLFMIDFGYYAAEGRAITEAVYVHGHHGPIPDAMVETLGSLEAEGRIRIDKENYYNLPLERVTPLGDPDMSFFSRSEMDWFNRVIRHLKPFKAKDLELWGHSLLPWAVTKPGEKIPYYSVFLLEYPVTGSEDIKWARAKLKQLREKSGYAH